MSWYKSFGSFELVLAVAFVIFYVLYISKVLRVAKQLQTPGTGLIPKVIIRSIYFVLIIVALLGPSFGAAKKEIKSIGKDIMIAVDLSQSMNAFDIAPTRLEKIKFELKRIVGAFSSDRIGLIIFSSEAFMQCPLTYDQAALNLFIETLNTNLVPGGGTDFGPPLSMALKKIDDADGLITQQKSKVIVLISDGEDFGDDTESISKEIEKQGIKLFTLGVGTESGSQLRSNRGFKTDKDGNVVVSRLDSKSLRNLASKTGGEYFEINETKNEVSRLINTISNIEGQSRDARLVDVSANRYHFFLLAALLLMVVDVLINFKTISI
jgi:Ca-activated chloride channel homolog